MIKNPEETRNRRNISEHNEDYIINLYPILYSMLKTNVLSPKSGMKYGLSSLCLLNIVLEFLAKEIRQEKVIKIDLSMSERSQITLICT
jgi:hypothetical protein